MAVPRWLSSAFLVLAAFSSPGLAQVPGGSPTIRGRVEDATTRNPIEGARIFTDDSTAAGPPMDRALRPPWRKCPGPGLPVQPATLRMQRRSVTALHTRTLRHFSRSLPREPTVRLRRRVALPRSGQRAQHVAHRGGGPGRSVRPLPDPRVHGPIPPEPGEARVDDRRADRAVDHSGLHVDLAGCPARTGAPPETPKPRAAMSATRGSVLLKRGVYCCCAAGRRFA
jgi:hypothetical protein